MSQHLGRWAAEAKTHLQKHRPKMPAELQAQGKLDDWALKAADRAGDEAGLSIENRMQPLEAGSGAKKNHYLLPSEEDQPELAADPKFGCWAWLLVHDRRPPCHRSITEIVVQR